MKKKLLLLSTLAIFLGFNYEAKANKDTLVIANGADAKTLDIHASNDAPSAKVTGQIYDTLVKQDSNMNIVPGLAESWKQVDDKTTELRCKLILTTI